MSAAVSKWTTIIQELPIIHNRLKDTILHNKDFREVILEYNNNPDVFFYLDPPYMEETRRKGKYIYEMAREDHEDMLNIIKDSKSMIMLSGYENSLYVDTLPRWRLLKIPVSCSAVGRSRNGGKALGKNGLARFSRIECVWLNPPLVNALRGERQ
jgi:DNA adenine methylase